MKPLKKIEIVTDSIELRRVLNTLEETTSLSGYTMIRNVFGMGEVGARAGDDPTDIIKNSYVMIACPEDRVDEVVEAVRPLLERFGGICLVSEAQGIIQ